MKQQPKPQSKTQMARSYGVGLKTFNRWLEPHSRVIGTYKGRLFTPVQVQTIHRLIGKPPYENIEK